MELRGENCYLQQCIGNSIEAGLKMNNNRSGRYYLKPEKSSQSA